MRKLALLFLMLLGLEPIQKAVGLKYAINDSEWAERLTSSQIGLLTVGVAILLTIAGSLAWPDKPSQDNKEHTA